MAPISFLNLLALSTLAVLAGSFAVEPVTAAIALKSDGHIIARSPRGHNAIAKKRKRDTSLRCQTRSSSSLVASSTSTTTTHSTTSHVATTSSKSSSSAVATTTTSSSSSSSTSTNTGGIYGKFLLAWPNGPVDNLSTFKAKNSNAYYTWSMYGVSGDSTAGLANIPEFWGWKDVDQFAAVKSSLFSSGGGIIFGPNEPNQSGQSDMDPSSAASLWQEYINPLASAGYTLVSPACSSDPDGYTWVSDFLSACTGCTVDAIGIHYYDVSATDFQSFLTKYHTMFNLPVYVTEYACQNFNGGAQCTSDETWAFHEAMVSFFQATDWIHMFAPFGFMEDMQGVEATNQLMSGGEPTTLGWWYLNNN